MDLHELFLVAGYEVKQQGRSWVFRFFSFVVVSRDSGLSYILARTGSRQLEDDGVVVIRCRW